MTTRAIAVVLDGLRRDSINPGTTPHLAAFANTASVFTAHRSVFPSATRVASACFATGCHPGRHRLTGNSMAVWENGRLVALDCGPPAFMDRLRAARGYTLAVPTLAQRLAGAGREAMIFSNVSPGAARAHDPDGYGWVVHRAWSHGPGLRKLDETVPGLVLGVDGDAVLTDAFLQRVVGGPAALGVLWLSEPDASQHVRPLGGLEVRAALAAADGCFARVRAAVEERRRQGEDILLLACSDHGHETITEVVDIEAGMIEAGLKRGRDDDTLLAVGNGTASLIYLHPDRCADGAAVVRWLIAQPWAGRVLAGADLGEIGHVAADGLLCAVSMASDTGDNAHGIPGRALEAMPLDGKDHHLGHGQHGGLGVHEQMPFMMIQGRGFARQMRQEATCPVDIAPTILRHLGLAHDGCDGRPLQGVS